MIWLPETHKSPHHHDLVTWNTHTHHLINIRHPSWTHNSPQHPNLINWKWNTQTTVTTKLNTQTHKSLQHLNLVTQNTHIPPHHHNITRSHKTHHPPHHHNLAAKTNLQLVPGSVTLITVWVTLGWNSTYSSCAAFNIISPVPLTKLDLRWKLYFF